MALSTYFVAAKHRSLIPIDLDFGSSLHSIVLQIAYFAIALGQVDFALARVDF